MLTCSCDSCGRNLSIDDSATGDPTAPVGERFVVEICIKAPRPAETLTEADLDGDQLDTLADLLDREARGELDPATLDPEPAEQRFRYDLCPHCHARYSRDPLGSSGRRWQFSSN